MVNTSPITPRASDYSQWYLDIAKSANLFEYSPVPGCITFMPKSVAIWDRIRTTMQAKLSRLGVQNLYLPMLIPYSFLEKEKDHIEGFAPECAVVTHGGGKELDEKFVIRPTSETLFCDLFRGQLQSYRDLPILYNQWVSVMRWEKRTRPFLRTAEFHWQEGHTLHETVQEAESFARSILFDVYVDIIRSTLAIDGIAGEKSPSERFAGALKTFSYEPMMSNGWALQICTSHVLSPSFIEGFGIRYLGRDGIETSPSGYTSWAISTRSIGGIISSHSDDKGLIIPPALSEYAAVILPVYGRNNTEIVDAYVRRVSETLTGTSDTVPVRGNQWRASVGANRSVLIDARDVRLGEKLYDFEISGYPVRLECGAREAESGIVTIVSRITGEKITCPLAEAVTTIERMFTEGQSYLLAASSERLRANTIACYSMDDIGYAIDAGKFALYAWDMDPKFEVEIKDRFKATTRCLPFAGQWTDDVLDLPIDSSLRRVIIARSF